MSEEEKEYIEHEIVDRLYCLEEKDFDKSKVEDSYIQAVLKAGKENKKLVDKLQKENEHKKETLINTLKENEQLSFDIDDKIKIIDKLQKENQELKEKIREYEIGIVKE